VIILDLQSPCLMMVIQWPLVLHNGGVGHVRFYDWDGTNWAQRGQDIDGEATDDNFGYSKGAVIRRILGTSSAARGSEVLMWGLRFFEDIKKS
jgi:hypothetical protein